MRRTSLYDAHVKAGARLVDFHGWEMPVQYRSIVEEAKKVRAHAGLFDLGHMGRLVVTGPAREALVERVFSANLSKMKFGKAKYGFLLNEAGFPIDDVIVYRDREAVHVVVNAGNRDVDDAWMRARLSERAFDAHVENVSDLQAMIAIQGPDSEATIQPLVGADLSAVPYYGFTTAKVCGVDSLLARTGYTGEDGFEVFPPRERGLEIWETFLAAGKPFDVEPIGLGARDALRLEAGMPLYGQEISLSISPLEAGLDFGVDLSKTDTVGIPALAASKAARTLAEAGLARRPHGARAPHRLRPLRRRTTPRARRERHREPDARQEHRHRIRARRVRGRRPPVRGRHPRHPLPRRGGSLALLPPGALTAPALGGFRMPARPQNARYTKSHEWVRIDGDTAVVGITDFAVEHLGDLVFVDLPAKGKKVKAGESLAEVESVKAVGEVYAPVSGEVVETNAALANDQTPLSKDPLGAGWLVKMKTSGAAADGLMDAAAYQKHLDAGGGG